MIAQGGFGHLCEHLTWLMGTERFCYALYDQRDLVQAIAQLDLQDSFPSLKAVIQQNHTFEQMPEMFCFGLLEAFDMEQLKALAAPRPVVSNSTAN